MTWLLELLRRLWPWRHRAKPPARKPLDLQAVAPESLPPAEATFEPVAEIEAEVLEAATPAPEPPPEPQPELEPEKEPSPADALLALVEDDAADAEEDAGEDEEEYDDPSEPDPFISADGPVIASEATEALERRRAEALELALGGEHRIYLTDAAGPGTPAGAGRPRHRRVPGRRRARPPYSLPAGHIVKPAA